MYVQYVGLYWCMFVSSAVSCIRNSYEQQQQQQQQTQFREHDIRYNMVICVSAQCA